MKTLILSLVVVTFLAVGAQAADGIVNCNSTLGTNHSFSLVIVNENVAVYRVRINSHRVRSLLVNRAQDQSVEGFTLYTFVGSPAILEVDNQILAGSTGVAKLENDEFSCL